jgi:hypothetical protein
VILLNYLFIFFVVMREIWGVDAERYCEWCDEERRGIKRDVKSEGRGEKSKG